MSSFQNKVALITGGSSGIGRATTLAFAREGAKVIVASRREDESQETVRLVREAGSGGLFVRTDVSLEGDVKTIVEKTIKAYGRLDIAFSNTGIENLRLRSPSKQRRRLIRSRTSMSKASGCP